MMRRLALLIVVMGTFTAGSPSAQAFRTSTPDQIQRSGLVVGFRVHEYFGETYAERSPATALFFQNEPISFTLVIANAGSARTALVTTSTSPQNLFRVQAFVAPSLPPGSSIERVSTGGQYVDERPTAVPVTFSSPVKAWSGGRFDVEPARETPLDSDESLEWQLRVPSEGLSPGVYRLVVKVDGAEPNGRAVQGAATFSFEVRPAGADADVEIKRRKATRAYYTGDFSGARQAIDDLLRVHPDSYEAHVLLFRVAAAEGKREEAERHRATADAVLLSGRDQLLLKHAPKNRIQEMIDSRKLGSQ